MHETRSYDLYFSVIWSVESAQTSELRSPEAHARVLRPSKIELKKNAHTLRC